MHYAPLGGGGERLVAGPCRPAQQALRAARIGVFGWDLLSGQLTASRLARSLLGLPLSGRVSEQSLLATIYPDDRPALEAAISAALSADDGMFYAEIRTIGYDADARWIAARGRACKLPGTLAVQLTGTVHDISARKLSEQAREAVIAHKELLLHEVNHRVKNSLQLVSSMLNLQVDAAREPRLRQELVDVRSRIDSVASVHRQLYCDGTHNRVDAGEMLKTVASQSFEAVSSSPRISIEIHAAAQVTLAAERASALALLLCELLSNAVKHAFADAESGRIRISLAHEGAALKLAVSDNGRGLPDGFDPATSNGLGMRIVHGMAKRLQGQISIRSGATGTRIELLLPKSEADSIAEASGPIEMPRGLPAPGPDRPASLLLLDEAR